jgi:hypothetical protein
MFLAPTGFMECTAKAQVVRIAFDQPLNAIKAERPT